MTLSPKHLILESIVSTEMLDGSMHIAPMGPEVTVSLDDWILKPFQTSMTFRNLQRSSRCIVHVVDDAGLMARAVLGHAHHEPAEFLPDRGYVLNAAAHWYALVIDDWNLEEPRAVARGKVVAHGVHRPFFGWNRAKHAIVELAIVASRVDRLDATTIAHELARCRVMVEKTASQTELQAFEMLADFLRQKKGLEE